MDKRRFALTLRLMTTEDDEAILAKRFRIASHIYNVMVKEARKRLHKLRKDKDYQEIMKHLSVSKGKYRKGDKTKLRELNRLYGLSEYNFHFYIDRGQKQYSQNIDSQARQKIATNVWRATEKVLYSSGQIIRFHKERNLNSISGKSNATGIRYRNEHLLWNGLDIPVRIRRNDSYARECLEHDICYCRVVRRWHKHKYRYYIQIVFKGIPPQKHVIKDDNIQTGIDIGPSTIAVVSNKGIIFTELASDIDSIDADIQRLNRKLDRQRRNNNPDNYNKDGTIKRQTKSFKRNWKWSSQMKKINDRIRHLYAKRANKLKQSHFKLANEILELGTDIYIEDMNMQGLAKRSKKTEISENTGRYKRKKRFGKSVGNHAPAMLINILNNKLSYMDKQLCKVSTYETRLSQLNHLTGEYEKHDLSYRWKVIGKYNVQRDLYSAFLLSHMKTQKEVDIDACYDDFDNFMIKHNAKIDELRKQKHDGHIFPSCMGI